MTLDQFIERAEEMISQHERCIEALEAQKLPNTANKYKERLEEYKQLAELLKELKELRGDSDEPRD